MVSEAHTGGECFSSLTAAEAPAASEDPQPSRAVVFVFFLTLLFHFFFLLFF